MRHTCSTRGRCLGLVLWADQGPGDGRGLSTCVSLKGRGFAGSQAHDRDPEADEIGFYIVKSLANRSRFTNPGGHSTSIMRMKLLWFSTFNYWQSLSVNSRWVYFWVYLYEVILHQLDA